VAHFSHFFWQKPTKNRKIKDISKKNALFCPKILQYEMFFVRLPR
jgi:hypothetical protein